MSEKQDDIVELKFPDSIRTRPGMYIGELTNPSILLREIVDNAMDEVYNSEKCKNIIIYNLKNKGIVIDEGRGISITRMPHDDVTMAYKSLYSIHAGSKFNKTTSGIGQNGVGTKCANALSTEYILIVKADEDKISNSTQKVKDLWSKIDKSEKIYYCIIGNRGILKEEKLIKYSEIFNIIPEINKNSLDSIDPGTIVSFTPDDEVFESTKMSIPSTLSYFKYIVDKIYHKDITVLINDKMYTDFYKPYENEMMIELKSTQLDPKNKFLKLLISYRFNEDFNETSCQGSVNGIIVNQGFHINNVMSKFRDAYGAVFGGHNYKGLENKGMSFSIIAICPEPTFASQTKERCADIPGLGIRNFKDWEPLVEAFIKEIKNKKNNDKFSNQNLKLIEFISVTQDLSKKEFIRSKITIAARDGERRAAQLTPARVRSCTTRNRKEAELLICEGRSALGSLIQARNPKTQACMPLRGKPLNSTAMDIVDILDNEECKDIINTIGTGVDEEFSLEKVNYGKIIIVADADPDGSNIASLLLGLFYGHMKYLIESGYVYICNCPLFKQNGKFYYEGDEDKLDKSGKYPITRFKGLGEMDPDEMKYAACDPKTRKLTRITKDGMGEAIRLITSTFARKQLMVEYGIINDSELLNAKEVFK